MPAYLDFNPVKPAPRWNEEVTRSHAGEDGPCWRVETTREMFIDEQAFAELLKGCHAWALYEFIYPLPTDEED